MLAEEAASLWQRQHCGGTQLRRKSGAMCQASRLGRRRCRQQAGEDQYRGSGDAGFAWQTPQTAKVSDGREAAGCRFYCGFSVRPDGRKYNASAPLAGRAVFAGVPEWLIPSSKSFPAAQNFPRPRGYYTSRAAVARRGLRAGGVGRTLCLDAVCRQAVAHAECRPLLSVRPVEMLWIPAGTPTSSSGSSRCGPTASTRTSTCWCRYTRTPRTFFRKRAGRCGRSSASTGRGRTKLSGLGAADRPARGPPPSPAARAAAEAL